MNLSVLEKVHSGSRDFLGIAESEIKEKGNRLLF